MNKCLVLFALFLLTGCNQSDVIFNVSEQEAIKIESMLIENSIVPLSKRTKDGVTISVPDQDRLRATTLLSFYGMPSHQNISIKELFPPGELVASPFAEKNRLVYGVSNQLKKTIESIPGVIIANVDLSYPEYSNSNSNSNSNKASIVVIYQESLDITETFKESIRAIVVNATHDIKYSDVSVSFFSKKFNEVLINENSNNALIFSIFCLIFLVLSIILGMLSINGKQIIKKIRSYKIPSKT